MNLDLRTAFPNFENKLIENLEDKAEIKVFEPGEILMKTGQYFKSILLIVDGLIKVYREDEEGHEYFIYYLQPGQACALSMMSATRQEKSEVLGKVVNRTTVIAIPLEYMDQWMHDYKSWYNFVLETYRKRFEELLITLDHTAFRNMDEKLIFYLKREQLIHHTSILTINNTEVAQELNSSREVISRLMKKLAERGMIKQLKNQLIEIVNLDY
ncbi:MAG: Crp/Fnr family transcriptional regulator [Sphingobacteriales bacterium]|nr:Crp/Fnr family transcriptional regulator [Sphingobacteriales bacterium]MBI3719094.1 Crp/Fnr family transcriptional regulator [Sphingobacteriales bacterium]